MSTKYPYGQPKQIADGARVTWRHPKWYGDTLVTLARTGTVVQVDPTNPYAYIVRAIDGVTAPIAAVRLAVVEPATA